MKKILHITAALITGISCVNAQFSVDVEMTAITTAQFIAAPATADITFDVKNTGTNTVTVFDAEWTDGTTTYSQTFSTSLISLGTASFTFNDQLPVALNTNYNITATITDVNGTGADDDNSNDSDSTIIHGMSFVPTKIVVGEEGTGTWCGWCPRGWDYMDYMTANYSSNWIGIAIHNSDPMTDFIYDVKMDSTIGGYPAGHVDRAIMDTDPSNFENGYNDRVTMIPPASIGVSSVLNGNTVDITVTADFATNVSGDYRLNCVVTENGVQNDSYHQTNYYDQNMDPLVGYGYDWGNLPDPAPGSGLIYNHVARAILSGWNGEAGSVPSSVTNGQQVNYTWSYTIPAGSDINNMEFIGMLIDQSTGEILNAGHHNATTSLIEETVNFDIHLYPNPFTSFVNIVLELDEASDVTMEVYSATGRKVTTKNYGTLSGETVLKLNGANLESGIYFVDVTVGGQKITKKVSLMK